MPSSKIEVLVNFDAKPDENQINLSLNQLQKVKGFHDIQYKNGAFLIDTTLPSSDVLAIVSKTTGSKTVLQGFGETQSAVAMISSAAQKGIMGVVRFQQSDEGPLVIDGTIDGLKGEHGIHIHENGDLSQGCDSIGAYFDPRKNITKSRAGDLGVLKPDDSGRATFRIVNDLIKVNDIVGRSVAVSKENAGEKLPTNRISVACGIIARSAGVFQNPKRFCACDGVVVWDESERPLAGEGRRKEEKKSCCGKH